MGVRPQPHETVLYRAAIAGWMRLLALGAVMLLAALALAWNVGLFLRGAGPTAWSILGTLLFIAVPSTPILLGVRQSFTVTTLGITVVGQLRTRRIPWAEVRVVRISQRLMDRGAADVVLRDGTTVRSPITAARSAIRRGESTFDHGADLKSPARPARAAIEAHRRYLRGEFVTIR
ncbi:PH domain-containing protein [Rothia halotolerans]|uniref:PH domain-containing protein n=1 Tax=Rothia halotolerans TaxID=405770 RepID=UPI00101D2534|nr:PH domain-containing protein [Rothia halotolerans]